MQITKLTVDNRGSVDRYIREAWGGPMIVSLGNIYDTSALPGFIAVENNTVIGAILYRSCGTECEIAAFYTLIEGRGIGTALMDKAAAVTAELGCRRLWLVTTNDNTHAIRFYQKYGFSLKAVHIGSFAVVRKLKSGLPANGIDDIPIEHEFEFELYLRR